MKTYKNVDEYLKSVSKDQFSKLKEMRSLVNKLVPNGKEGIKYGMPTIEINGKNFIHYACMKGHLGFYPSPSGVSAFENEFDKQEISFSKGCIRFSYSKPLPIQLITKIIKFRLKEIKTSSKL